MGYHETYEFFAIDRPLGTSEMEALRGGVRPPARCASRLGRPGWTASRGTLHLLAEFLRLDADLLVVALGRPPTRPRSAGSLVAAARRRAEEGDVLGWTQPHP